jgi:hypothetical protein
MSPTLKSQMSEKQYHDEETIMVMLMLTLIMMMMMMIRIRMKG